MSKSGLALGVARGMVTRPLCRAGPHGSRALLVCHLLLQQQRWQHCRGVLVSQDGAVCVPADRGPGRCCHRACSCYYRSSPCQAPGGTQAAAWCCQGQARRL